MTTYVCAVLIENTCTTWVVQSGVLPELSTSDAYVVCTAILAVLGLAWGYKKIGQLLK